MENISLENLEKIEGGSPITGFCLGWATAVLFTGVGSVAVSAGCLAYATYKFMSS
ncbi:hypothetical protein [Flammeovirga aprica]|uniref:Uncharacterized protein n=1 Tax=Flammeovirga aprica JL-4 TaxID=694437 RepID=A0A7X9S103_9BACT|nr:hypothetical protein [Flammeovirga aprica]NME72421.1 hypothetical protein [Flammeovirga aprica JL-4]